jgi:hypothetical protein
MNKSANFERESLEKYQEVSRYINVATAGFVVALVILGLAWLAPLPKFVPAVMSGVGFVLLLGSATMRTCIYMAWGR